MTDSAQALAYKLYPYQTSLLELKQAGRISLPSTVKSNAQPWNNPPAGSQAFQYFQAAALVIGAVGGTQIVVSFQVPAGRNGVIAQIANQLIGGGFNEGTGNVVWKITLDGQPAQGFDNIISTLGTTAQPGDLKGRRQIVLHENQTVQLTIKNVGVSGIPNLLGMLAGYFWPLSQQDVSLWL